MVKISLLLFQGEDGHESLGKGDRNLWLVVITVNSVIQNNMRVFNLTTDFPYSLAWAGLREVAVAA